MSLKNDKQDFADYLQKSKLEPDPVEGSKVWADDPAARGENYKRVLDIKDRRKALKKKKVR